MTYQDQTFDAIMRRMVAEVDRWSAQTGIPIDTRDGSIIRFALGPAAAEMLAMYIELGRVVDESFADTQSWDYLVRRAAERGIFPHEATAAIRQGEFNIDVPPGAVFSLNLLSYTVRQQIAPGIFRLECNTSGSAGNVETGKLIPHEFIQGLEWARLTNIIIPGQDREALEHFRQRYFSSFTSQAFGGNIADYVRKTTAIPGVGGCKVYPVWNGGGTVRVAFISSMYQPPGPELVNTVQEELDPGPEGLGKGLAPIGHTVTVVPVNWEAIDVNFASITLSGNWTWENITPHIRAAIQGYFAELAEGWDKVDWIEDPAATLVVRISQIESRVLTVPGVIDVSGTTLNGSAANITLGVDNIPGVGAVTNGA